MSWMRCLAIVSTVIACGPANRSNNPDSQPADAPWCPTSISGKVFAPNGTLPLYNVMVYMPAADPPPFPDGVQCGTCSDLPGGAIAHTTSDAQGNFHLTGLPPVSSVPVIITTGKWRRKLTVPVTQCQDNPVIDGTFRLPRNRTEGEMPRIAQVTGGCDALACILTKIGIDSSEFGDSSSGSTAVVFYNGSLGQAPGSPQAAEMLWGRLPELKKFDLVINSCECDENNTNKTSPDLLRQYADMGGRVFGSHYHYTWERNLIPQWKNTAVWEGGSTSTPDLVDTSSADGQAFSQWLIATGASTTPGQITLGQKIPNASTVMGQTKRWLYSSGSPATTHYLSFTTPVGAPPAQQCGKVVYAGMHVASGYVDQSFPAGCSGTFTPDEMALAFLLFDLTACNQVIQ
jgi:hypothetical protein